MRLDAHESLQMDKCGFSETKKRNRVKINSKKMYFKRPSGHESMPPISLGLPLSRIHLENDWPISGAF